jgi:hypothetical protein
MSLADRSQQEIAYFRRSLPRTRSSAKGDNRSQAAVAFGRQKGKLPTKGVPHKGYAAGVYSRLGF